MGEVRCAWVPHLHAACSLDCVGVALWWCRLM